MSELAPDYQFEEWVQHEVTHRLTQTRTTVADLDVAVKEDVGIRAADKLKHLYPERGLWALTVLQHAQSLVVGQHWTARGKETSLRGLLIAMKHNAAL